MAAVRTAGALVAAIIVAVLLGHAPVGAQAGYPGGVTCSLLDSELTVGESVTVEGTGFEPGSTVTFSFEPGGIVVGTDIADDEGVATLTFTVPAEAVGSESLVCSGVGVEVGTDVNVSPAGVTNPPQDTGGDGGAGGDDLARTGIEVWTIARVGLVLFALGAALYLITRKRQRDVTTA